MKHKILLTLLTNHRLDKLKRLVKAVESIIPDESIEIKPVIVVNTLNDDYYKEVKKAGFSFDVVRTDSNGKPGKGKNSCRNLFLDSDCDFMSQVDGDDWLYPTWAKSMAQHIHHYPNVDVVGLHPVDYVGKYKRGGHEFTVGPNDEFNAGVWGGSLFKRIDHGPGEGHWVKQAQPMNFDRLILQSKLSAKIMMDEDIPNGEDHLYSIQLLKEHQDRNLRYFITMSSDFYISDATSDDNIQNVFPFAPHVQTMKDKMLEYVRPNRSSQEELPVIFNDLLISHTEKEAFIKETF
jgi:hypothetical protein